MAKCTNCGGKGSSLSGTDEYGNSTYQHCLTCGGSGQVSEHTNKDYHEDRRRREEESDWGNAPHGP